MHRRLEMVAFIVGLFAAIPLASETAAQPNAGGLTLATWNIEHLADLDGQGCRPRTEADYARLREFVAAVFDRRSIVAIQNIESAAAATRVFSPRDFTVVISGQAYPSSGGNCAGRTQQQLAQRVGFAIGRDVQFTRNADVLGLNTSSDAWPLPVGADVTVGTRWGPLRLLSVHLKPGCPQIDQTGPACSLLLAQIPPLETWIEARGEEDQPFAILGDFNRHIGSSDVAFWKEVDDGEPDLALRVTWEDLVRPRLRQVCPGQVAMPFVDHIVLSRTPARKYVRGSLRQEPTVTSDHCPVLLAIQ